MAKKNDIRPYVEPELEDLEPDQIWHCSCVDTYKSLLNQLRIEQASFKAAGQHQSSAALRLITLELYLKQRCLRERGVVLV